ncbi:menaquinol-cytochrome c reductase cytochrome b/c subunit [Paenibacillus montaniterrae]|uniref:Menaquinol-cytochrome c reductase cytochrome b/c subunit n=1 Tax=Paenibacillus montaniterrae TaxID=429341 RepID=A0A920CXB0_9BACL|nr:menaquinol-cytochrome c reductase cytochrome b/c subunit [Paenibacillus montaniterrae]GIP15113.1 menaquinol-cytochrome c reductase cytochrome b/c subunit [Paenibacillus montaniterrae]
MAHGHKSDEKVVYVGDSRVKKSGRIDGTPPDYTAFPGKSEAFIPNFLLKEWMVGCVVLVGFLVWVMAEAAPLGYPADPTNASFIPMPDWYFLFLYQFLKYPYVSQDYVLLGTIGVPAIMFGALLLAPFLDTGKERRFYRRPIASSLMLLSLAAVTYLTVVSWSHYQDQLEEKGIVPEHHERAEKVREALERGEERPSFLKTDATPALIEADDPAFSIVEAQCISCHAADLGGGAGPSLIGIGNRLSSEEIAEIITHGTEGGMPAFEGMISDEEITQISEWLAKQTQS